MANKELSVPTAFHISPFERINFGQAEPHQPFKGKFSQVMNELRFSLNNPNSQETGILIALHPPRITRGIIDYFVNNPHLDQKSKLPLVQKAVDIGLNIYGKKKSTQKLLSDIEGLENSIRLSGHEALLVYPVIQIQDKPTWDATHPDLSRKTANRLLKSVSSENVVIIALGHGSTSAGMDLFFNFSQMKGNATSQKNVFYPVRLSTKKQGDKSPHVSDDEAEFLKATTQTRQAILFDEDVVTGNTLRIAREFFLALCSNSPYPIVEETNLRIQCTLSDN